MWHECEQTTLQPYRGEATVTMATMCHSNHSTLPWKPIISQIAVETMFSCHSYRGTKWVGYHWNAARFEIILFCLPNIKIYILHIERWKIGFRNQINWLIKVALHTERNLISIKSSKKKFIWEEKNKSKYYFYKNTTNLKYLGLILKRRNIQ